MPTYQLYGVPTASTLQFSYHVSSTTRPAQLHVESTASPLSADALAETTVLSRDEGLESGMPTTLARHQDGNRHVLRFGTGAEFILTADRITYHLSEPEWAYAIEVWLLGTVFSLWNELRGVPALHTAAVVVDGQGVGFLATNKGGKSSLSAALMQVGCPLLTDDILMVEGRNDRLRGVPSYPQMRMWPDQARHFLGTVEELPRVVPHLSKRRVRVGDGGFGQFQDEAAPITHLLLPERRDDVEEVQFQPLSPQESLIELIRHSFLPNAVSHLGLSSQRLPVLSTLAQQADMCRLVYPDGVEHLPRVASAIRSFVDTEDVGAA